jgi:hypothetical protein
MAYYFDDGIAPVPFVANEDMTNWQFKAVIAASVMPYVAKVSSTCGQLAIGILQNDPSAGQEARVKTIGFTKAAARANASWLAHGRMLFAASDGFLEPAKVDGTTITSWVVGRWFGEKVTTADASVYGNVQILVTGTCLISGS